MRVNLYTTTYNNENLLDWFVSFYKQRVPNIIIRMYDLGSTDLTKSKAEELGCIVNNFKDFYQHKDQWRNECWKNIPGDAVVICNINEYVDITPDLFKNCTLIQAKGYDISSLDDLTIQENSRNYDYDKFCIFDKGTIKEMNYTGGTSCNPVGFVQIGEKRPILYHLTKIK